ASHNLVCCATFIFQTRPSIITETMPGPTEFSRAHLKSRNSCLFLKRAAFAALKSLGIHKRFLRFLPYICLPFAKNPLISLFSDTL
ncbi:hypothetical protein, partial [Intestinimonas massiliensis (ex Afouda et al. 2020)]